jgi:hypothetical protein
VHLVLAAGLKRRAAAAGASLPCFGCGYSCAGVAFDDFGRGRCPACSSAVARGQWTEPMDLPVSVVLRDAGPAFLVAAGLLLSLIFSYGVLLAASARLAPAKRLLMTWERLTPDLQLAADLAALGAIAAAAVAVYRRRDARRFDLQHRRCRSCGHDLSATPLDHGRGRCGECGMTFVRVAEHPQAGISHHG